MKNHIAFKFIAIFLCAAMLTLSLGCGTAVAVLVDNGLFDRDIEQLRQQRLVSACEDLAHYLAADHALKNLSNCSEDVLYEIGAMSERDSWLYNTYAILFEEGEWYYTLENPNGLKLEASKDIPKGLTSYQTVASASYPVEVAVIPENYIAVADGEVVSCTEPALHANETWAASYVQPVSIPDHDYAADIYDPKDGSISTHYFCYADTPEYTITLYLTENAFPIYEAADWQLLELAQQYRFYLLGGLIAGLLFFSILLVYLCCAAGRKPGSEEVSPQAFNKLPLDLYAVGVLLGSAGCIALTQTGIVGLDNSGTGESFLPQLVLVACAVFGICLLLVCFFYACAAQFKMPKMYALRRSVIGICCIYSIKFLRRCGKIFVRACRWLAPRIKRGFTALWAWLGYLLKKLTALVKKGWALLVKGLRWLGRTIRRGFSLLPLTWQWLLVGFLLIGILFLAIWSEDAGALLLGLAASVAIILYGSNCFGILLESAKRMSKGDLETKVSDQFLIGSFKDFAGELNALAGVAVVAAEKQMKSERMKAELVTNVSHDIKTPLTSIINYVDLLQKAESSEQAQEYLEVLDRQSQRMKKLIDDLMEMSKASTGNLPVDIRQVDAVEAINQALGEFADKLAAAELTPIFTPPEAPVMMRADGRLAWRVLSNLLSNAVKYALPGTRLYIDLVALEGKVLISLKNISREQLNVSSEELMERFVRGDASRNTEGSGLGLNIAKSLMDLQHGQLQLLVDGDLFKATLIFPESRD